VAFLLNNNNAIYSISASVSGYPFSLVGWFRVPDSNQAIRLMGIASLSTGAQCDLIFAGDGGKEAVAKTTYGSSGSAYSTSPMIPGQWHHLTSVFVSDNERRIYLDGGNVGVNNTNIPIGPFEFFFFGNGYTTESIGTADVALIEAVVSAEEAAVLAKGYPLLASPSLHSLSIYHDCIRNLFRPGLGPVFFPGSVGPTVVEHPRTMFAKGGYSIIAPDRVRGPFRIEQSHCQSLSAASGQTGIAGVVETQSILPGEVVS